MALKCGIVGLPNVGKSTLFNALTSAKALAANYAFATKEPNMGVITVPDDRLKALQALVQPQKVVPTAIDIVDIAGLIRGASKNEGLGNKFLGNIREVNAIVHVVRCFDDDNILHVDNRVDPVGDKETIDMELIFKDMESVDKQLQKQKKMAKGGDKALLKLVDLLERLNTHLESGQPARSFEDYENDDEELYVLQLQLLTAKPIIYVCNVDEASVLEGNHHTKAFAKAVEGEDAEILLVSAAIEADITELDSYEERLEFLQDMGLDEPGVNKLIRACYRLLNLITYFTAGEKEVRAWTIKEGTKAPQAAGVIHSDFERGFIKAKTVGFDDFVEKGGWKGAQEQGSLRQEGKEYVVSDGDVLEFMFNV